MSSEVLVAYSTKYGATAEIAERIGAVIRTAGLSTDVLPVEDISNLAPYGAVVLGSAVYVGQWRRKAAKFLKANEKALAERPVWLFSSGPTGEGDPVELVKGWRFPKRLQPVADRIQPRDTVVFGGAVDAERLSRLERSMLQQVGAPAGDFRDWEAIASWAGSIADALQSVS